MSNTNNEVFYEIYVKDKQAEQIISKIKLFDIYDVSRKVCYNREIIYYDTPDDKLKVANILLSKDTIINGTKKNSNSSSKLIIEKNIEDAENEKFIKMFESYQFSKDIPSNQSPQENISFLNDSLARLLFERMDIDPEFIFRKAVPEYKISIYNESYRIVNVNGFKCNIIIEHTTFNNLKNKRENFVTFVHVQECEDSISNNFDDFITRLEKYCKCILRINESKYKQCVRMTRDIELKKKINKNAK